MEFRLSTYAELPSSNNVVKHAIEEGEDQGLVVRTFKQTAGYGRLGRSWVSPEGGLYFSILLRPVASARVLPTLGLATCLALHRTVQQILSPEQAADLHVKWPNDLVWKGGDRERGVFPKISGMSFERHAGGVCIGIGVNVFRPANAGSVGGKNVPVYVADLLGARLDAAGVAPCVGPDGLTEQQRALILALCDRFLDQFRCVYDQWQQAGLEPFLQEYSQKLCLQGERVLVVNQLDESVVCGVVDGVDSQGRLLVRTDSGLVEPMASGEVRLA